MAENQEEITNSESIELLASEGNDDPPLSEPECTSDTDLLVKPQESETHSDTDSEPELFIQAIKCPCGKSKTYSVQDASVPRDRLNLVYICFFLAGAGFLFPFNSFVSAIDYFYCLYRAEFSAVSEIIPMTYLVITLLTSTVNLLVVERLPSVLRIGFGYVMFSVALFFIPMLDIGVNNGTVATGVGFYLTLLAVLVVGLGSGFQQSSYYGVSSMLPPRYSQALLAGESVAGFIVALNRIFTKLVFSERAGAIVFFVISLLFVWCCVGCFVYIRKSSFVKYHTSRCQDGESRQNVVDSDQSNEQEIDDKEEVTLIQPENQYLTWTQKIKGAVRVRVLVVRQIWGLMFAIFTNYLITLLIFPGLLSEVQYNVIGDWTPVVLITLFNFTDFLAKWLALMKTKVSPKKLLLGSFSRVLFIPLAILCVSPSPCNSVLQPGVIAWSGIVAIGLGLSNGYFGSVPMINVGKEVKDERNREIAGSIMIWCLLFGLSAGSVLAYAVTPLTRLDPNCTLNSTCAADLANNTNYTFI